MEEREIDAMVERTNAKVDDLVAEATALFKFNTPGTELDKEAILGTALQLAAVEIVHLREYGPDDPDELRRIIGQAAHRARSQSGD